MSNYHYLICPTFASELLLNMSFRKGQKVRVKPGLAEAFPAMWNKDVDYNAIGTVNAFQIVSGVGIAYVMFEGKFFPIYLKIPKEFLAIALPEGN